MRGSATTGDDDDRLPVIEAGDRLDSGWHSVVWVGWAIAGTVSLQLAPNPYYVAFVVGVAWVIVGAFSRGDLYSRTYGLILGAATVFALFRVVIAALTVRGGSHLIFVTPSWTLPRILGGYSVGGAIDGAVILDAAAQALVVVGIVAVFGAFNSVVSHHELVAALPRAFFELGVVVTVGLTFVPATLGALSDVREADRARTGGVRRRRLLRTILPVLETGMERAVMLSESMDSRGFARETDSSSGATAVWLTFAALVGLCGAFGALVVGATLVAGVSAGAALLLLAAAIWTASRSAPLRYRRRRAGRRDWIMIMTVALAPVGLALATAGGDETLRWPEPVLGIPALSLLPILSLSALLAPLAWRKKQSSARPGGRR